MSRHELTAKDPNHRVIVGWDHPLMTFFVQVIDKRLEETDNPKRMIVWKGTHIRELYEVEDVGRIVGRYAELTADMASTLYGDKDEGR